MSTLAVIAYPDQSTAAEAAAALQRMQKELLIDLQDVAWVTKAQDGKLKLHQGTSLTGVSAAGGAMWGFLFGLIFLVPLAGMALGAATGALAGHLADYGIDDKWIKEVASSIHRAARRSLSWRAAPTRSGCCRRWPSSGAPCSRPTSPPSSSRHWKRRWPRPLHDAVAPRSRRCASARAEEMRPGGAIGSDQRWAPAGAADPGSLVPRGGEQGVGRHEHPGGYRVSRAGHGREGCGRADADGEGVLDRPPGRRLGHQVAGRQADAPSGRAARLVSGPLAAPCGASSSACSSSSPSPGWPWARQPVPSPDT